MISVADPKVQYFLRLTLDFLEDLDKEKLSVSQKTTLNELVDLTTEFYIDPQSGVPRSNIKREETYDDDGGIYGEIGSDIDDEEHAVNRKSDIKGEGAKILNLHASYKGWLRDDVWFRSVRWWALIWRQKLLFYTDANTNNNPSKTIKLTKETKVTIKGSDKFLIEVNSGNKPKKFEFKVESGDINKWKSKLDEEIDKSIPTSRQTSENLDDSDEENAYDDMTLDIIDDESPPASPGIIEEKSPPEPAPRLSLTKKKIPPISDDIDNSPLPPSVNSPMTKKKVPPPPPQSFLNKKKIRCLSMSESVYENNSDSPADSPMTKKKVPPPPPQSSLNKKKIRSLSMADSIYENNSDSPANSPMTKKKVPRPPTRPSLSKKKIRCLSMAESIYDCNSDSSLNPSPLPCKKQLSANSHFSQKSDSDSSEDITYDDMCEDAKVKKSNDSDERNNILPSASQQPIVPFKDYKVPDKSGVKKFTPPPPPMRNVPAKIPDEERRRRSKSITSLHSPSPAKTVSDRPVPSLPPKRTVPAKVRERKPSDRRTKSISIIPHHNPMAMIAKVISPQGSPKSAISPQGSPKSSRTQDSRTTPDRISVCPADLKGSLLFKKRQELEKTQGPS